MSYKLGEKLAQPSCSYVAQPIWHRLGPFGVHIFAFWSAHSRVPSVAILRMQRTPALTPSATPQNLPPAIELTLTYGSEKKAWINDVTAAFNADRSRLLNGKRITVTALPMGSGELVDEVLTGTRQPDLISPASGVFVKLGNAQSRAKTGDDLLGPTDNLVLSPVVIAMWKPMAEALGYGKKAARMVGRARCDSQPRRLERLRPSGVG